jgi:hypothetical protein
VSLPDRTSDSADEFDFKCFAQEGCGSSGNRGRDALLKEKSPGEQSPVISLKCSSSSFRAGEHARICQKHARIKNKNDSISVGYKEVLGRIV